MSILLGFLLVSFILNFIGFIPFINLLYKYKIQRQNQRTKDALNKPTPIFDKYHRLKAGIPIGGGLLLIITTSILFVIVIPLLYYFWFPITSVYSNKIAELRVLFFTFLSFGMVGLFDDIKKVYIVNNSENFFGLRLRHKLILELVLAFIISFWLYFDLKIDIINVPFLGVFHLGKFYILFAAFVITSFANAFNITDGLDGLASGLLMIALTAFWVVSNSILDTTLSLFITLWIGGLLAFLYFNIYPARLFLGDVGALSFGATLAVIGLLLGKPFTLLVIGGIFVLEISSSLLQLVSKKIRGKKLFKASPFHLWFQEKGWHETTIVFRAWLLGVILAIFGLWLAFIS